MQCTKVHKELFIQFDKVHNSKAMRITNFFHDGGICMLKSTQFSNFNDQIQGMVDTYFNLTNTFIENFRQAVGIQCDSFRGLTKEVAGTAKNLCTMTDPNQASSNLQNLFSKAVETYINKNQALSNIVSNSHAVFSNAVTAAVKDAQKSIIESVESSQLTPALSKTLKEALQNSITNFNHAADTFSKVSGQVADVTRKNMQAATQATLNTLNKSATQNKAK